jgi:hypothetical protein
MKGFLTFLAGILTAVLGASAIFFFSGNSIAIQFGGTGNEIKQMPPEPIARVLPPVAPTPVLTPTPISSPTPRPKPSPTPVVEPDTSESTPQPEPTREVSRNPAPAPTRTASTPRPRRRPRNQVYYDYTESERPARQRRSCRIPQVGEIISLGGQQYQVVSRQGNTVGVVEVEPSWP